MTKKSILVFFRKYLSCFPSRKTRKSDIVINSILQYSHAEENKKLILNKIETEPSLIVNEDCKSRINSLFSDDDEKVGSLDFSAYLNEILIREKNDLYRLPTLAQEEMTMDLNVLANVKDIGNIVETIIDDAFRIIDENEAKALKRDVLTPKFKLENISIVTNAKLRHSGFSNVQECNLLLGDISKRIALKTYKLDAKTSDQGLRYFKNEVSILKSLDHQNILKYIGVVDEANLSIITEWCSGPNLFEYIQAKKDEYYNVASMHELMDIAHQVSKAIEYLHANEIIHRDLKSKNVYLNSTESDQQKWNVKVGDFGFAVSAELGFKFDPKEAQTQCVSSSYW